MMRSAGLALIAAVAFSTAQADDSERVARESLYALYANDAVEFQKRILPEADSAVLIGRQTFTPEQLEKLRKDIDALPLHRAPRTSADGTKAIYSTQYRGVGIIIPMERTETGWKVDVRFWLAMRKQRESRPQKTDPEIVAKGFLFHILAKRPEALNEFTSERLKGEDYTAANNLPPGDLDHILSLVIEMPIVRARVGERAVLPSGEVAVGADGGEAMLLIALFGSTEIPFLMKRIDGAWKVVPQKYFEMLRKAGAI